MPRGEGLCTLYGPDQVAKIGPTVLAYGVQQPTPPQDQHRDSAQDSCLGRLELVSPSFRARRLSAQPRPTDRTRGIELGGR
mgnify:CR=1 FL=1